MPRYWEVQHSFRQSVPSLAERRSSWRLPTLTAVFSLFLVAFLLAHSGYLYAAATNHSTTDSLTRLRDPALAEMQRKLDIERFSYYAQAQRRRLAPIHPQIAKPLEKLKDLSLVEQTFRTEKLNNPSTYDTLLYNWLRTNSGVPVRLDQVAWNWNFFKNRLSESFVIRPMGSPPSPAETMINQFDSSMASQTVTLPAVSQTTSLTLDGLAYLSHKTTQSIFTMGLEHGLQLYLGSKQEFLREVGHRNAAVVGLVQPLARNYNPIYILKEASGEYRVAVTEIGGASRLRHFLLATSVVEKGLQDSESRTRGRAQVEVFGDASSVLLLQTETLKAQLLKSPQPDLVVIGQKSAIEKAILVSTKLSRVLSAIQANPRVNQVKSKVAPADYEQLLRINSLVSSGKNESEFLSKSAWIEKMFEESQLSPIGTREAGLQFTVEHQSFEYSDYILQSAQGQSQRWRLFSNVWGDEISIIAESVRAQALSNRAEPTIVYIGTAGALPRRNLAVGDLVLAQSIESKDGAINLPNLTKVAPIVRARVNVTTVDSPLEETHRWLSRQTADVVELETSHLARALRDHLDKLSVYLLVSDVVGSEESLDSADARLRKTNQISLIQHLVNSQGILFTSPVQTRRPLRSQTGADHLSKALAEREPVSQMQLRSAIDANNRKSRDSIISVINANPPFRDQLLYTRLAWIEQALQRLIQITNEAGLSPQIYLADSFFNGSYHPSKDQFLIHLRVRSRVAEEQLLSLVSAWQKEIPQARRWLSVQTSRGPPDEENWRLIDRNWVQSLGGVRELYSEVALKIGGLARSETRSERLRLIPLGLDSAQPGTCSSPSGCQLAFFKPDDRTAILIQQTQQRESAISILRQEANRLNQIAESQPAIYRIKVETVPSLDGGDLARIIPDLSNPQQPHILLQITHEGARNPLVLLEEWIHLQQITNSQVTWSNRDTPMGNFTHPYHWFETVENARLGSPVARARLVRAEVEAIAAAEIAYKNYARIHAGALQLPSKEVVEKYFEARLSHAEEALQEATRAWRQWKRTAERKWTEQRAQWTRLESRAEKLDDLIARNARREVAELISAYLPWSLMEPVETTIWKQWLEAIRSPSMANRSLVFRGMYDDNVRRNSKGQVFLMSTILTRNQGSYTRRLRSLATMRERFTMQELRASDAEVPYRINGPDSASVAVSQRNHSIEAKGSPYLSTSNLDVAFKFGPRQIGAFLMDTRRLVPNALPLAPYIYQHELLTPLIIFPDEVVAFHDYKEDDRGVSIVKPQKRMNDFVGLVEKQIGRPVTKMELSGSGNNLKFLTEAWENLSETLGSSTRQGSSSSPCGPVFE